MSDNPTADSAHKIRSNSETDDVLQVVNSENKVIFWIDSDGVFHTSK